MEMRPTGTGLVLRGYDNRTMLARDLTTGLLNLYDFGAVPAGRNPLWHTIETFRQETGLLMEVCIQQTQTIFRDVRSDHECGVYHIYVGTSRNLPATSFWPMRIEHRNVELNWWHNPHTMSLDAFDPKFALEIPYLPKGEQ